MHRAEYGRLSTNKLAPFNGYFLSQLINHIYIYPSAHFALYSKLSDMSYLSFELRPFPLTIINIFTYKVTSWVKPIKGEILHSYIYIYNNVFNDNCVFFELRNIISSEIGGLFFNWKN